MRRTSNIAQGPFRGASSSQDIVRRISYSPPNLHFQSNQTSTSEHHRSSRVQADAFNSRASHQPAADSPTEDLTTCRTPDVAKRGLPFNAARHQHPQLTNNRPPSIRPCPTSSVCPRSSALISPGPLPRKSCARALSRAPPPSCGHAPLPTCSRTPVSRIKTLSGGFARSVIGLGSHRTTPKLAAPAIARPLATEPVF